jgi:hypothetical protein
MGTGSFSGVKCGRGVLLTTHPLLAPRSWKSRFILLSPLGHNRACNRVMLFYMLQIYLFKHRHEVHVSNVGERIYYILKNNFVYQKKKKKIFSEFISLLFGRNVEFATCRKVAHAQLSGYFKCLDQH